MLGLEPVILAAGLIGIGALMYFGTRSLLRAGNPFQPAAPEPFDQTIFRDLEHSDTQNGLFVVQQGGKIVYANRVLREWLNLTDADMPNLEHLARRTRPSETFLELCASPGHQRFSLQGMMVDGISYYIPYKSGTASLVTLQRPDFSSLTSEDSNLSGKALDVLSELSVAMTSSDGLEATVLSVLESVERLIPSDFSQITIYDPSSDRLVPHRLTGMPSPDRELEKPEVRYKPGKGYTGTIFKQKKSLLVTDVSTFKDVRPSPEEQTFPFQAFLGVPLQIGGTPLGTLGLGSLTAGQYQEKDLQILHILSNQAAIALQHAQIRQEEARRVAELSGLANLAQAIGGQTDTSELIGQILERVQPLLNVDSLGFLLYDENSRQIAAQIPFIGIPDEFKDYYVIEIPPASERERIWLAQESIAAQDARNDPTLQALGISPIAQAAGLKNMLLTPLAIGGRALGYIQAANKQGENSFNQDDIRLAAIIAGQVAPLLENATLLHESRRRTRQAEALRRIAGLAGSAATLEEILQFSLNEISRLVDADSGAFFLYDEENYALEFHPPSAFGKTQTGHDLPDLKVENSAFSSTATGSLRAVHLEHLGQSDPAATFYAQVAEAMEAATLISVPLIVRDRGLGEMVLGSRQEEFFQLRDLETAASGAGQVAGAIERAMLSSQTDESLRQRVEQLTSLTRISRELNASLDLEPLLTLLYKEAIFASGADCGSVLLLNLSTNQGDSPEILLSVGDGHNPSKGLLPIERSVLERNETVLIEDFDQSEYDPPHSGIGTALVLPVSFDGQAAGLFHLHARTPKSFDARAVENARALAAQAAIALGNAHRFQRQVKRGEQFKMGLDGLARLLRNRQEHLGQAPLENALTEIAKTILDTTPFQNILISVYESEEHRLRHAGGAGFSNSPWTDLQPADLPWDTVTDICKPDFERHGSFVVPEDRWREITTQAVNSGLNGGEKPRSAGEGDSGRSLALVPIQSSGGSPLGLVLAVTQAEKLDSEPASLETLAIFTEQAALTIENHVKFTGFNSQVDDLEREIRRLEMAGEEAAHHIPLLLQKDLEQIVSIKNSSQRTRMVQQALEILRQVNRQPDRAAILSTLGEEMVARMGFETGLVAETSDNSTVLSHVAGNIPERVNPQALLGQRNPLRNSLQSGETYLVESLRENGAAKEWGSSPLLTNLNAESFICLPIPSLRKADKCEAAFLGIKRSPSSDFAPEDQRIFKLIGDQVSIALENIHLIEDTQSHLREVDLLLNFGRQLGSLKPDKILGTLVDNVLEVVTKAEGSQVALWDPHQERLVPISVRGYHKNAAIESIRYEKGQALPGRVFQQGESLRVPEVNIARDYDLAYQDLLNYKEGTGDRVPVSSLVVPITAGESILGVLVLDNFSSTQAFEPDDEAVATSLAAQTGVILENARLLDDAEQRARQLQSLTDISTTITSDLKVGRITASLLDNISKVIPFETGTFWLRQDDGLTVRAAKGSGEDGTRLGATARLEDSPLLGEILQSGQAVNVADLSQDGRNPPNSGLPHRSWLGVPLSAKGEVIGVIALEKKEPGFYGQTHIQLATTFAGQAAVALENARLYEESLQRSQELDTRTQRLDLLNQLSNAFGATLDPVEILQLTVEKLYNAVPCLAVSAAIIEDQIAVMKAEAPIPESLHPVELDAKTIEELLQPSGMYLADDVAAEGRLQELQAFWESRGTQSAAVFQIASAGRQFGLLFLHGETPFSGNTIELARTFSYQAASALQNARLFARTQSALDQAEEQARRLARLNELSAAVTLAESPADIFEITVRNAPGIIPNDHVSLLLLDQEQGILRLHAGAGEPRQGIELAGSKIGAVIERNELVWVEKPEEPLFEGLSCLVAAPLSAGQDVIGAIVFGKAGDATFTKNEQNLLLQISTIVSAAIVNKNLLEETRRLTEALEERVEDRTRELAFEHQRIETLLGITTELSASLDMDIVLNRTLSLINRITGAEHSTIILANPADGELLQRAGLGFDTVAMASEGETLANLNLMLAGWVIRQRQAAVIPDLGDDLRWNLDDRSTICSTLAAPLMLGPEALGALLLYHREKDRFTDHHLDMIQAAAKQIAVAVNNSQLYHLIRDQAERLGGMLRTQQIEASRLLAILEAVADGVLVTDARGEISVFNASAERILELDQRKVVGQPLENFSGFFGQAGLEYMETIKRWSRDPGSFEAGETFSEEIELDDSRVVAVNLAPVSSAHEFLGTVSIFRDITHLIEVDRMKSEFVATVSHELRTPLTSIKGYVDILLMGAAGTLSPQQAEFLQIVQGNTERLNILVNDLLEVTRIEAGKISLTPQAVDVAGVAGEVTTDYLLRAREQEKNIDIQVNGKASPPLVFADPDRLRQILDNLVSNAYHYTPDDGQIVINFKTTGDFVQVDIQDTGVGVSPEDQERIFERFYRGDAPLVSTTAGTGLGLSIVRYFVELHGGKIWLNSRGIPGEGTTFSFTLPIFEEEHHV